MKKRITIFLALIIALIIPVIGFSSWLIGTSSFTNDGVSIGGNTDNLNITLHTRKESGEVKQTIRYFQPKTYSIKHQIVPFNEKGEYVEQVYTWKPLIGPEKRSVYPKFFEKRINADGKEIYSEVVEHGGWNTYSNTQIQTFQCDVSEWVEVQDKKYKDVRDCTVKDKDNNDFRLFFKEQSGRGKGYSLKLGDIIEEKEILSRNFENEKGDKITEKIYQQIRVDKQFKFQIGLDIIPVNSYVHYPIYSIRKEQIILSKSPVIDEVTTKTIIVKKNSYIKPDMLQINGYEKCGYFKDSDYSIPFNFKEPITSDTDIYLRVIENNTLNLSDTINSKRNGKIKLYDNYKNGKPDSSNECYSIDTDPLYYEVTNQLFLNETVINESVEVQLTYGNSEVVIDPEFGLISDPGNHADTKSNVNPYYYNNQYIGNDNVSTNVILNGNLIIKGTLVLGGEFGSKDAVTTGILIGKFSSIDLYGNDITIDGGTLKNYGMIYDSVGGGQIIVKNGGKIQSTITIDDSKLKNQIIVGFSKSEAPFTSYKFAYIQVPVKFEYGTTFTAYSKLDLSDVGMAIIKFNIFTSEANNNKDSLFVWGEKRSNDYIYFYPYEMTDTNFKNKNMSNLAYLRNRFYFHTNIVSKDEILFDVNLTVAGITKKATLDLLRVDFPLSTYFDFIVASGYEMKLGFKLLLMPGSNFVINENALITLFTSGEKKYSEQGASAFGIELIIPAGTKYLKGSLVGFNCNIIDYSNSYNKFTSGIYSNTDYRKLISYSNHAISGNIKFDTNIDSQKGRYEICGNIDASELAINSILKAKQYVQTYSVDGTMLNGFLYGGKEDGNTYSSLADSYQLASHYSCLPLITSDKSYIIDSNLELMGDYDKNNNIFTSIEGKKYFLKTTVNMLQGGINGSVQKNDVDNTVMIKSANIINQKYKIIESEGEKYISFSGIYVPLLSSNEEISSLNNNSKLRINMRKFLSNNQGCLFRKMTEYTPPQPDSGETTVTKSDVIVNVSPCFDDCYVSFNSSKNEWQFYCFTKYPKLQNGTDKYYSY